MPDWEQEIPERFRIAYDRATGAFRILDTWHESIRNISDLTQDVPDSSPAMKTLSSSEVNALAGELKRLGWLEKTDKEISIQSLPARSKSLQEVAIEEIRKISALKELDSSVAREAIIAVREIVKGLER